MWKLVEYNVILYRKKDIQRSAGFHDKVSSRGAGETE